MAKDWRRSRVKCTTCGHEQSIVFAVEATRRTAAGQFRPLPCAACGELAAEPTAPPYVLTDADRQLLRSMRITQD